MTRTGRTKGDANRYQRGRFSTINNDGTDAITGTFAGLPEGSYLRLGKGLNVPLLPPKFRAGTGNGWNGDAHLVEPPVVQQREFN